MRNRALFRKDNLTADRFNLFCDTLAFKEKNYENIWKMWGNSETKKAIWF